MNGTIYVEKSKALINRTADRTDDQRLCFHRCKSRFSHDATTCHYYHGNQYLKFDLNFSFNAELKNIILKVHVYTKFNKFKIQCFNSLSTSVVCWLPWQTVWTQIRRIVGPDQGPNYLTF